MMSCEPLAHSPLNLLPCSLHTCTQKDQGIAKAQHLCWGCIASASEPVYSADEVLFYAGLRGDFALLGSPKAQCQTTEYCSEAKFVCCRFKQQ